jgi:hypothetical protein
VVVEALAQLAQELGLGGLVRLGKDLLVALDSTCQGVGQLVAAAVAAALLAYLRLDPQQFQTAALG